MPTNNKIILPIPFINVTMKNPEAVIEKYKQVAEKVEGVISL